MERLFCSGVSLRRIAILLKLDRKTVARKLVWLGSRAKREHEAFLAELAERPEKVRALQFDEMETFERSKCLPLSIPLAVEQRSRKILGFRVGEMPAKGPLAEISLKKYGRRADRRTAMAASLLSQLEGVLDPRVEISSDENPKYPAWIRARLPRSVHKTFKGRRGCVVGQGELKKIGFDPLFDLNHTCAMFRANVNRLFRRTWCTTKRPDRLEAHLYLYLRYHNTRLT